MSTMTTERTRSNPAPLRSVPSRILVETRSRLFVLILGFVVLMAVMGGVGYTDMAAEVAQGAPRTLTWSPELRGYLTDLNPATFVSIAATDTLYKAYFSFGLILAGLITWRVVGVASAEGIHKYFLLGGQSRLSVAVNSMLTLALLLLGLIAATFVIESVVGVVVGSPRFGAVTPAQVGTALALYAAAFIPLSNYALVIALAARLHASRIALLISALTLPIPFGLMDTLTVTKQFSPWGILSMFATTPRIDGAFWAALGVEACWLVALVAAFMLVSQREQLTR